MESSWLKRHGIDLPIFCLLLILPLQWKGSLSVDLGFFKLGVGQMPSWFLVLIAIIRPVSIVKFFRYAPLFHTLFLAYYLYLGFHLIWADDMTAALLNYRAVVRPMLFYFALGAYLVEANPHRISRAIFAAAPLSLIFFIFYAAYTVANTPINELDPQIRTGNPRVILLTMVNYSSSEESIQFGDDEYQTGTIKNNIAAAFNTLLNIFVVFGLVGRARLFNPLALLAVVLYPIIVLSLLSRSNFGALVVGFSIVVAMYQVSPHTSIRKKLSTIILVIVILTSFISLLQLRGGYVEDFVEAQEERYEDTENDIRWPHYRQVFMLISKNFVFGYGIGERTKDDSAVHNLFLGAWFQMGLMGLGLACGYYFTLVFYMGRTILGLVLGRVHQPKNEVNQFFIPTLLVVPLIRAILIGGYGQFQTPDVVAVAVFIFLYGQLFRRSAPPVAEDTTPKPTEA